jgi:ABC-type glycerol-3-phosphate transport system substrate-binding protein
MSTPGLWSGTAGWDIACLGFDCKTNDSTILGVPIDSSTYFLFYNKADFAKAGIASPPSTYNQLYSDCTKLRNAGISEPLAYGDQDGYTTVNWLTINEASTFDPGDMQALLSGKIKYTDPKLVDALAPVLALRTHGCTGPDASTTTQFGGTADFISHKAAMIQFYPVELPQFQQALKNNLGIGLLPMSGNGPLTSQYAGCPFDNWVIPKGTKNLTLAWDFIKIASDEQAGLTEQTLLGTPSANLAAQAQVNGPEEKYIAAHTKSFGIPLMDSVMPNAAALFLYKELSLAFAGKISGTAALAATQQFVDTQAP